MTQETAHMPLDEQGLEAATYAICILLERGHATEADLARYGVHAYLQTAAADVSGLVERLRERAESYRMGGPSSEHTAALLDEAASTLQTLSASNAALEAEIERLRAERKAIRDKIPMAYLQRHDVPGATGPTDKLDLVAAVKDFSDARWRLIDRLRAAEDALSAPKGGQDHG